MDSVPAETVKNDEKDYEVAVDEIFSQMNLLDAEIRRKQVNIDRLRIETQALLDDLKTVFLTDVAKDLRVWPAIAGVEGANGQEYERYRSLAGAVESIVSEVCS